MDFENVYIAEKCDSPKMYRIRSAKEKYFGRHNYLPLFVGTREECHAHLNSVKGAKK